MRGVIWILGCVVLANSPGVLYNASLRSRWIVAICALVWMATGFMVAASSAYRAVQQNSRRRQLQSSLDSALAVKGKHYGIDNPQ